MVVLADWSNPVKGKILPATVVAELEFDSVRPPPDKIEEEDEG